MKNIIKIVVISILVLLISCSKRNINEKFYRDVEAKLTNKDYKGSAKSIEKSKKEYGKNNKLLFFLDLGWSYHLAGDHFKAQTNFKNADNQIDDLFTKDAWGDVRFRGEDFEKVLLTIFRALDYAYNNKFEDATVEARKVNERLKFLNSERKEKSAYQEDAFGRYLAGVLYESQKEYNDAYLSYYKAYKIYKEYQSLYRIDTPQELKKALKKYYPKYATNEDKEILDRELNNIRLDNKNGKFVFIHYNGYAPKKVKKIFTINPRRFGRSDIRRNILMGYADFKMREHTIKYAKVFVQGEEYKTELVHPISRIAIRNLRDRLKRSWSRMVRSRISRYLSDKSAQISFIKSDAARDSKKYLRNAQRKNCLIVNGRVDCSKSNNTSQRKCLFVKGRRNCDGNIYKKYKENVKKFGKNRVRKQTCSFIRERVYCANQRHYGPKRCWRTRVDCSQVGKFNSKIKNIRCNYNSSSRRFSCNVENMKYDYLSRRLEKSLDKVAKYTKEPDLRSWRLPPAEIDISNINLEPNIYKIDIEFCDRDGKVVETTSYDNVKIENNKEVFKWYRTIK